MVDVYAQIDATRDEQKAKAGKRDNVFARFKKMWRDAERNIHHKRVEAAVQKRMADQYNRTAANPNLSPQEREAIERWKAERW